MDCPTPCRVTVRSAGPGDHDLVADLVSDLWGGPAVVAHGVAYEPAGLPAVLALTEGSDEVVGLLTYHVADDALEVVTIDALVRRSGVGSALMAEAVRIARDRGLRRLWLVTTNDNVDALRFYQRRGLRIVSVGRGAVDASRALKPTIPLVGAYGIELHDELILELALDRATAVDAEDQAECWCCGQHQPSAEMIHLGNHPEVILCLGCAHFVHKRAQAREDATRSSPIARARDWLRAGREYVIRRQWHHKPVIGPVLRWLGPRLP
jgi:GNAT superfamily N-acetyltransferase